MNSRKLGLLLGLMLLMVLTVGNMVFAQVDNVILMIGDGMGVDQMSIARYYKGQELAMDKLETTGFSTTHSANSYVTDSAAGGTAIATGYKTNNGWLSVRPNGAKPRTLLESAQHQDKKVGLVTTTRITHATPASFAAHINNRDKENQIAEQILNHKVDVLLGGGQRHFLPQSQDGRREDGKNLLDNAENMGYEVVQNRSDLMSEAYTSQKLLGVFTNSHMSYELNRSEQKEPSIAEMTEVALNKLNNDQEGFFLMVEGGRIDHAAHGNDVAGVVGDLLAFDRAVKQAMEFIENHPDTLLIVTADHETGGLGLSNGEYKIKPEVIQKISKTASYIGSKINEERTNIRAVVNKYANVSLTNKEVEEIKNAKGSYEPGNTIGKILSNKAMVDWTTRAHTGAAVPVIATGSGSDKFTGLMDNTDLFDLIAETANYRTTKEVDIAQ